MFQTISNLVSHIENTILQYMSKVTDVKSMDKFCSACNYFILWLSLETQLAPGWCKQKHYWISQWTFLFSYYKPSDIRLFFYLSKSYSLTCTWLFESLKANILKSIITRSKTA